MKKLSFLFLLLPLLNASAQPDPCTVVEVVKSKAVLAQWSPDSSMYLVNKMDSAGIFQIYVGRKGSDKLTCISNSGPGTTKKPWKKRHKMQTMWHPSGKWIICAVEKEKFQEEWLRGTKKGTKLVVGWLACGLWMDIYALKPDGSKWCLLAVTKNGMTGPAFTPDGKQGAWAEAMADSTNMFKDKFGRWKLMLSQFSEDSLGNARFTSTKNITPKNCKWIEPGNFSPNGHDLLLSADIDLSDARGQDQFILDINTGKVTNLNNTPKVWDEHGLFSPDGKKIIFMSSYPYRHEKNTYKVIGIKTEFMLMNCDGSGLQQLTHFLTKGYPESSKGMAAVAMFGPDGQTVYATTLIFPDYEYWIIKFKGNCGNQ